MAVAIAIVFFGLDWVGTDYAFLAAYTVLQFVVLATAWNILGGYAGYVNFASAAFFAVGVYTSVIVYKTVKWPLIVTHAARRGCRRPARARHGISHAAAARHVLLDRDTGFVRRDNTLVVNWAFVGGSRGVYVMRRRTSNSSVRTTRYL